jgi:hypothetical protein
VVVDTVLGLRVKSRHDPFHFIVFVHIMLRKFDSGKSESK